MKFLRYLQKKRRAMLAMAALTFFASPLAAQASTITTKDGKTLTAKNKVYNIEVQKKLSEQVGVNKFKDFTLDKGQIANMQFNKLQTLANLVDNKININGTVNALRDGKIGGNLYFLSPEGIAVGASGVINAGAFTGMAVDKDYFDKLSGITNASDFMVQLAPKNIVYNNDPDKGIDIQGVINAPGGISLYATKIDIGKEAKLRTDVSKVNFKDVVNIENVDSGITGGLDASYKDGDIILKAHAEHVADDNILKNITQETATQWEKISERTATINVDGKLFSAGDVSINADSKTTFSEGSYFSVISQSGIVDAFLGSLGIDCAVDFAKKDNAAIVNINKTAEISSAGNMDISSKAELEVSISAKTPAKSGTTKATDWIPATAVSVISATNNATVNVDGKLTSGGRMSINADASASLSGTAEAKTAVATAAQKKGLKEDPLYIGVSVVVGENNAEVNINAGEKITVGGKDTTKTVDNEKVTVNAFEANATVTNSVSSEATAANVKPGSSKDSDISKSARDDAAINTAVNVVSYTDKAIVNVNRDIEATNGGIGLNATNDISNSMSTSTTVGKEIFPFANPFFIDAPDFLNSLSSNAAKKVISLLKINNNPLPDEAGGSTLSKIFSGEYFKTGIAVGVFEQDNTAKVNVGSSATLTAKNNIDLNAKTNISSLGLSVDSTVNNQSKNQKTNAMIGLGVLVSDINNDADAVIGGKLINTDASGTVNVKTDSGMDYNQFYKVTDDIRDAFIKVGKDMADLYDKLGTPFEDYNEQVETELKNLENSDDPDEYMSNLSKLNEKIEDTHSTGLDAAIENLDDTIAIKKELESLPSTLLSIIDPSSYANYYALSAFYANTDKSKSDSSKIDAAGAFSINNMTNNSRIALNKSAAITAKGNVDLSTLAKNRVVAITGMGGPHLTSSEANNKGAGISVKVGKFDNNSLIAVGDKAQISGKDVKLATDENSRHVNIIYGNGKADSTTVTGMVSVIRTPTDSIVSVNDSTNIKASGKLDLTANTEDYITSVNGGLTMGNGGGKSVGAAINILTNDKNTAVHVADNYARNSAFDKNISALNSQIETLQKEIDAATDVNVINSKKADLKSLEITKRVHNILGEDSFANLGDTTNTGGLINASELTVKATNWGKINAIAIEGTENSESHQFADQFNDKVYKGETAVNFAGDAFKFPSNLLSKSIGKSINDKLNKSNQNNAGNAADDAGQGAGNEGGVDPGVDNNVESQLNVAAAGSVAVNITGGETGALINNTTINADTVNITADDDVFHGSWAGAGAFNFFGQSQAAKNTNVGIGGAVAYTDTSQNVDAIVKNSTITANAINNSASRADSDVSAGMGLAVSTNSGNEGKNIDVAISASINFIDGDTHALLLNNTGKNSTINNAATIDSLQVAGGLDIAGSSGGGKGFNLGGSAAASKINNDLQSGISGGSYDNLGNVDITATKKTNQVDVAVAGGITTGSNTKGFSFGGAVSVSDITNNSRAFLDGTTKFNSSGTVNVDALDVKNSNSRKDYLSSRSINSDATSYLDSSDSSKLNGGSTIVNVALGGGASTGESGSAGIGISYNGLENIMNVSMSDNTALTAKNLNTNSANNSEIVNVTLGLAGSNKSFSAAGSVGISDLKNDSIINISNTNATADKFANSATSNADIVNVAGQAALGSKFAGGLTFAYNAMNNSAETNIKGGTLNVGTLDAVATNDNYAFGLGAGVAYSKNSSALNGSVALNIGDNSTKAIVDGSTVKDLNAMNVTATDKTSKTTIAGNIAITSGGNVAAGGAVAYANIGTASDKEVINAKIINSDITTKAPATDINVKTADKSTMTTVGVGVGGSTGGESKLTFQGAAAVSEVNKDNIAEVANTTIDKGTSGTGSANLNIEATSGGSSSNGLEIGDENIDVNNKVNTAAAALDVNISDKSLFDGALAISVNKYNQSTQANLKSDSLFEDTAIRAGNVSMNSNSQADILGVAIGGSGSGSKVGASGSVSYNYIDNTAKTTVEKENATAAKNFGVVAQSDDMIANYAGAVNLNIKGHASIGVSVTYNEIKGNTDALVNNSKLNVGNSTADADLISVSNPKNNLVDGAVTKNTWTSGGLFDGRETSKKSGLVVNSSATHAISSDLATVGLHISDKAGAGVAGTVNINKIGGATNAKVIGTSTEGLGTSVAVNAADYTNNGSFVGAAAVSGMAAIGILWNENPVDRGTHALVDGGTYNVKSLDVTADSRQGISNLNVAVGAAVATGQQQSFAAASGDNVVRNQLTGKTSAILQNATVNHSGTVNVDAYHKDAIYATNMAIGAAFDTKQASATFDLGYGLGRENSTVTAEINNSTLTSTSGSVLVHAENLSKIVGAFGTMGAAVHAGDPGFSAAVALGINNNYIENTVNAGIKNNSTLNVGKVDVNAKNNSQIKADGGVAALAINISESFFASLGAAVAITNATFDNKVSAEVDKSTINANGDVSVNAEDNHKANETVVSAAGSTGLAVAVNRMSTSVNSGLADLNKDALGKSVSAKDLLVTDSDNASRKNATADSDKLAGEFGDEHFINDKGVNKLLGGVHTDSQDTKNNLNKTLTNRYTATVNYNNKLEKGVFALVSNGSSITASGKKISIGSTENNDLSITSGSGSAGIVGIGVGSNSIKTRRANASNVVGSTLNAKDIEITTTNGQTGDDGIQAKVYNATVTAVGASVGYSNIETNGTGEILISGSNINAANNLDVSATDKAKSKSYVLDAGLKLVGYTGVFAYNTNTSQTGIEVSNGSTLSGNTVNLDTKNQTYRATDTLAVSVASYGVQTSTSEANDQSNNFINVKGSGNTLTGETVNLNALNGGQVYSHNNGQGYAFLNVVVANGEANSENTAAITIDDANTFKANTVNIKSQIGEDGKYTAESTGFAISVAEVGVSVDKMTAKTATTAEVNVGNLYYEKLNDNSELPTVNVTALNSASRNAFMRNNAYALLANIADVQSVVKADDKSSVTVGSDKQLANTNKLAALNITSDSDNKTYVAAKGTGGAIGGDFGRAAHAENTANNSSTATLNGTWEITDDLTLNANQHDSAYISGYSARGAILTGGKGSLDNEIKGSSTATISDGATINAKTVDVNSKNYITTDKYSSDYEHTLYGLMVGAIDDVDYQRSSATTNKTANINIGNNATITTTGTQTYDAFNDFNLKNKVFAEGGSGLVSLRWAKSHNYITTNENINVGTGTTLKNEGGSYDDGGITMAAHDNLELDLSARGHSDGGAGGYVRAENKIDLSRNPTININGTVRSAKDLNLYAGADANGDAAKVNAFAEAISQVLTLISDGSADIIRKGSTNAAVNVNSGAEGQATHDVNIIANAGNEIYEDFSFYGSTWSSDTEHKVVTSDQGNVTTDDYKHNNKVKVDGNLKAALTPDITVNIKGIALPDDFILVNDSADKKFGYTVKSGDITISKYNDNYKGMTNEQIFAQKVYNGISTKTPDYANDYLITRYNEVKKLLGEYSGDVAAYTGFQQEMIALEDEMLNLGMGSYTTYTDEKTGETIKEFKIGETPSIEIKALVLPDIEVSGGSINVTTNDLTGSGKLNASGVPKIDVVNDSSAYLITNKMYIADKGGEINYKGTSVASNSAINNLNSSKTGASFADLKVANSSDVPTISVSNNFAGSSIPIKPNPKAKGYDKLPDDAKTATQNYTPINFIEVTKDIHNPVGKVIINNTQGSIRINSGANVNGMDIAMTAKESISQGYNDGIVHIGTTPEDAYKDAAATLRSDVGWDKTMPTSNQNVTKTYNELYTGGTGRIAGDAIYIAARDININGLIQAGFNGFEVNITQADIDNATETTYFNGELMYKVNDGGKKLDEKTGYYYYEPQVYYSTVSHQLYVEDIDSSGGKVYLAGRILSTGNGKIVVSDGGSDIKVTNSSSFDMNMGKVTSASGAGFIQIVDTAQDKLTEFSSNQTRTINNYSAWLADNSKGSVAINRGLGLGEFTTYNPTKGLTYRWAEGTNQTTKYHYYKEEVKSWWGNRNDPDYSGRYEDMSNTYSETGKPEDVKAPMGEGNQIYNAAQDEVLKLYAQNKVGYTHYGIDRPATLTKSGLKGFYHHWHHFWNKTVGTTQTYVFSAKADYPISVGIIGKSNPSINLLNTNDRGGDLYLTGNIRNDKGKLNIRSNGGDIVQNGGVTVSTDNINLTAMNHIKNINVANKGGSVKLSANSMSNAGDIDINVTGRTIVDNLKSANGSISLTSSGNIKQDVSGTTVNARNIKLESTNGSINLQIESSGQATTNDKATISAAAKGDITLVKNDSNDFRISSIVSTNGDVNLTAGGRFVDALDKVNNNSADFENALVNSWIDMGLIAGDANYKGAYLTNLERERDNYKADVTSLFNEYTTLLAAYNKQLEDFSTLEMGDRLTTLKNKFGNYTTADEYLAKDTTYQSLVATAANPTYQWAKDDLLNGIRSAIVNKTSGSSEDVTKLKDANITAHNVTLTGTGVGTNDGVKTTINISEVGKTDNETPEESSARLDALKKLANAEAADVEVTFVKNPDGTYKTHTITRVNYKYDAENGYYIDKAGNYIRYRNDADGNLLKYTYTKSGDTFTQKGDPVAVAKDASGNYDMSDVINGKPTTLEINEIESFTISGTIPLGINATGEINVKTTGSYGTYIAGRNKGVKIDATSNPNKDVYSPLNINRVETSKTDGNFADVRLIGQAGVFNVKDSGANVIARDLVIVGGDGAIGTQAKPFAVQLSGDLLDARSNEEINLLKTGTDDFRISAIYSLKDVRITNEGKGSIQRSQRFDQVDESYINTPGTITLTGSAGTGNLPMNILPRETTVVNLLGDADSKFYIRGVDDASKSITGGTMNLNNTIGHVDISSTGSVKQTADGTQNPSYLKVAADGDIILDRASNAFDEIYVGKIGGKFEFKNTSDALTATFTEETGGDFTINQSGDLNLAGKVSGNVLNLISTNGNIVSTGGLKATEEIKLSSATFTHEGEIHTEKLTIATDKGVKINNTENTFSALEIASRNGKAINGSIEVAIKTDNFAPTIKNDVTGDVTLTNTKKEDGVLSFGDGETINVGGTFKAETSGDFEYGSTLTAGKDINIISKNVYRREGTSGYFDANGRIVFNVNAGNQIGTAENPIMIANKAAKTDGLTLYGEAHIKGVNDGILTLGDVLTKNDVSISSEGSIAQADGTSLGVKKITFSAAKDITLDNANNKIETLVLNTLDDTKNAGNVKVKMTTPTDLTVEGNFKTSGDVDITAYKAIILNGTLESDKNITLTAGKDNNNSKAVKTMTSNENSLLKAADTITLNAADINLAGKVASKFFNATTGNGLVMSNDDNAVQILRVASSDGKKIKGAVNVINKIDMFAAHINNDMKKDLTLINKEAGGWVFLTKDDGSILNVGGKITLDMDSDLLRSGIFWGSDDINITSRNGNIYVINWHPDDNGNTLQALGNLNLNAAGEVFVNGRITSGGDLNITSGNGGIEVDGEGDINAGENLTLTASGTGNIDVDGSVWAHGGGITISTETGNIELGEEDNSGKAVTAEQDINLTAQNGSINIKGKTVSNSGKITIKANNGTIAVTNAGDITASKNLTIATTSTGDIDVDGFVKSNKGGITISTETGNIELGEANKSKETVIAKSDVNITTRKGSINIKGDVNAKGKINVTANIGGNSALNFAKTIADANASSANETGNISVSAALVANTSVSLKTASGNIDVTKSITTTQGNIDIETGAGNITIEDNGTENMLYAQNDLVIKTGLGAIKLLGKVSSRDGDIALTAGQDSYTTGQSNITLEKNGAINSGGDVQLIDRNGDIHINRKIVTGKDLTADIYEEGTVYFDETVNVPGSVSVTVEDGDVVQSKRLIAGGDVDIMNGTGNITLDKVSAKNANVTAINGDVSGDKVTADDTVTIELERGNLQLNLAKGKGVVILTGNEDSKATVNTISANSTSYDKNIVHVWQSLPFQTSSGKTSNSTTNTSTARTSTARTSIARTSTASTSTTNTSTARTSAARTSAARTSAASTSTASNYFGNSVYNFGTPATLTVATPTTYFNDYSFDDVENIADVVSYRLTRNYFELRFAPKWISKEFMSVDFEDDFFNMRNATADELTID